MNRIFEIVYALADYDEVTGMAVPAGKKHVQHVVGDAEVEDRIVDLAMRGYGIVSLKVIEKAPSECRSCHAPIVWTVTAANKRMPRNEDGQPHWATCPQAKAWKQSER